MRNSTNVDLNNDQNTAQRTTGRTTRLRMNVERTGMRRSTRLNKSTGTTGEYSPLRFSIDKYDVDASLGNIMLDIELAPLVFADTNASSSTTFVKKVMQDFSAMREVCAHFFSENNIVIHAFSRDLQFTGFFTQKEGSVSLRDNASNVNKSAEVHTLEFEIELHHKSQVKTYRIVNPDVFLNPDKSARLMKVIAALSRTSVSDFEKYLYYWFIVKTFVAPDYDVNIRYSNVVKASKAMNNNSSALPYYYPQTPQRTNSVASNGNASMAFSVADELFDSLSDDPSTIHLKKLPSGIVVPTDLDEVDEVSPNLSDELLRETERALQQLSSMSISSNNNSQTSNSSRASVSTIYDMYRGIGIHSPVAFGVRYIVVGRTQTGNALVVKPYMVHGAGNSKSKSKTSSTKSKSKAASPSKKA
jgi:hypothetical protein